MTTPDFRLDSVQMANFAARGFLRFDELVPDALNKEILKVFKRGEFPRFSAGTPLNACYPPPSPIGEMLRMPKVQGIITSLVGPDPLYDHHAIHTRSPKQIQAQHVHGDAIIDTRIHFDIQLMYYPHDVPLKMGGTLIVPGSHFRRINESDIGRYQNFLGQTPLVGKAGTLLALHHGIWHCGRRNETSRVRYMYKLRLNPQVRQTRLWNMSDIEQPGQAGEVVRNEVNRILSAREPWFENADGRIEIVNRIKFWRFLSGDDTFDVQYWLTRIENMPEQLVRVN